ncbi:MAG: VOC family protein [Dehalococcoidia bacterium]|nr:VOC family protein [Dehalococcoidia bacterium]
MSNKKSIGNIDHVAVAVRSIEKAMPFFSELLGTEFVEIGTDPNVGFRSVMSTTGLELIEPTRPDSDIAKFIDKRGEGLYALAFTSHDADKARAQAEKMGVRVVGDFTAEDEPIKGLREIWLHPKDNFGVYLMLTAGNPFRPQNP